MISKFKPMSEFSRNVLTLMTGTSIAQVIPIAASPILTRIYTPDDFGIFALFMSIVSIVSVFTTGRYELAIMLPKKDEEAIQILVLSCIITFGISFLTLLIVLLFNTQITNLLGNPEISFWLYLIPISVVLSGIFKSLNYWFNRKKNYKKLAGNKVLQSGSNSFFNLGLGFTGFGASGLIFGSIIGQALATSSLLTGIYRMSKKMFEEISKIKILAVARRYIEFPKYDVLATLANVSSNQLTHVFFNTIFNATTAGYFYFTQRIMGLPISFIAASIGDVFREEASRRFREYGNAKNIYISTLKKLTLLSLVPTIILIFFAQDLFSFVFGDNWIVSGVYAQILAPMLFLKFISSPLSFMLYIGEKQQLNLIGNILFLLLTIFSFYYGNSALETVKYLSISFSAVYIVYLLVSAKIAKVF